MATWLDPVAPGSVIGDRVWLDVDGDGVQDVGEIGLSNVTVELVRVSDGGVEATAVTDGNGNYLFNGLYPGDSYFVRVVSGSLPAGLTASPGNSGQGPNHAITGSDVFLDDDFGYTTAPGTAVIGDRVWSDADGDGIQDPGEVGLGGVTVNLLDLSGGIVATTTTAPDGTYLFVGVAPGSYRVDVARPAFPRATP